MTKRKLTQLASALVILNLLDAIFTVAYTNAGVATECNPMMKGPLLASPTLFMIAKLSLVSLCVLLLWRLGPRKSTMFVLAGATVTYAVLIGYHLAAMPLLVAGR